MPSASSTIWCDLRALQVGDEADAAGVVLERGVEETLSLRTLNDGLLWRVVVHLSTSGAWRRNVREN